MNEKTFLYIIVISLLPAFFWIWFWLREDEDDLPEPKSLIIKTFIFGGLSALIALIIEAVVIKFQLTKYGEASGVIIFAIIEELLKFILIYFIALKTRFNNERIDPILYMIIGALGFSAIENMFYLADYVNNYEYIKSMIDSGYRFIGSTLVHTISSAFIGLGCAAMFFKKRIYRTFSLLISINIAIIMHALFNYLVTSGNEFYKNLAFYGSWVSVVLLLIIFEYLRYDMRVRPRSSVRHKIILRKNNN